MWVKICGIRDAETALRVAELGVDAIGLNFYDRSPRFVDVETASHISKVLPPDVAKVGVFVNRPVREVEAIAAQCQLNLLQLHGDEPPSYLVELQKRLPEIRLFRAWRIGRDWLSGLRKYLEECENWKCQLAGCLVDAHVAGIYGGSGKRVPWERLARDYRKDEWPPLILAGGLTSDNVSSAISTTNPWGVDVASGVESAPGIKHIDMVRQFVLNAKSDGNQPVQGPSVTFD